MNFFHLISSWANIFCVISRGRVGCEMASGKMEIPQMESLLAGYEARSTEGAIMRGLI